MVCKCASVLTFRREQDIVSLSGLAVLTMPIVVAVPQRLRHRKYSLANSSDVKESLQS